MEVTVEGHTISAEELQAGNWTPVLYKAYASRPACSQKPLSQPNATVKETNPNAMRVEAAATGRGKTPTHLPPATKETRIIVKRSKQLPPLPPNAIRVVVRPRGQLRLLDVPTPRLMKAVQAALQTTLPDDFCLRIHPTNNTFTAATTHSAAAELLKTLTSLTIGGHAYPCMAYVAPPPGATRGVISNAFDDETPTQLYEDLVKRNPEYSILAARRMGKTHSILITFDANEVPHSIKYMGAIHRCTPYRGSPDACTNCRLPGHRHDVCPSPKTNLCPRCGSQHSPQEPPCTPKCILCEGPHLTGTGSCKGRNLHQPRKTTKQPQTQRQEPVPHGDNFPQLSAGPTQPSQLSQPKQAWTEPLKQDWGPPRSPCKNALSSTVTSSLQDALAKSREEAAAAKAEAQAARAEAAALREHIAKLETQISTLATSHATPPTPTPTTSQTPAHNPPNTSSMSFPPSHVNATSCSDSLELDIDTAFPRHTNQDITPRPSTHSSLADIPTMLESFTARFEAKLQEGITSINQECTTLQDAVIRVTTDNAALNHRLDALAQTLTDRYNNLESQLNLFATRLAKRDLTPSKRKKPKATEGQDNPLPDVTNDSQPCAAATPLLNSHDGSSKP
ncbi:hypothetical protein HPB51_011567 [Rhipicephalus microplus]|uniref:Uncharacterized protein n=1 Tax=Rhipicephalus microplus TaxID=6941 RepID=A0A9J6D0R2_RHIMP|nr:hypothetical protein HPB51_027265 [Rhipicephalus microplus]KAH8035925.1 hypothetical protein HPB51_011567 [Rhipicephalus microplus]